MRRLPLLLVMLAGGIFLAFQTLGTGKSTPPTKYERILKNVGEMLTQGHYNPKDINDAFSKKVFEKYFADLDPNKNLFLKQDIESLRKFQNKIDDEIKGAPIEFFFAVSQVFDKRVEEASRFYKEILAKPFNFTTDEYIVTDAKKLQFAATDAERKELWRKRLKYLTLDRFVEAQEVREKNKGKQDFVVKTDTELEKEAREKVFKIMERTFDRYKVKYTEDEKFSIFVNTVTTTMDPYTEFFPPVEKRYFDEQLSGSFYGIGASLIYDEGNIKINSIINGSPAWKSQQLEVGDVIMKVGQKDAPPVELIGYVVEDAVKLIRGKKDSEVRLTVKKTDGSIKVVSLTREKINQDETFARSAVIDNGTSRIGYIFLPEFYANFEEANGSRSAVDVAKEVLKLKASKVDGIVIDLRNNGGGSLTDVVQIAGLFIEEGPIVQVKDRSGKPMVMRDRDNSTVLYDGPLAVMVNEFSASASEIFAAAIQDYGRGVVIGSTSTFGKGTVQRNIGLDPENFLSSNSELGTLKLTLQKFYRINGGSTQLRGVVPDIIIPGQYEHLKFRERDNPNALPWDEISKVSYKKWNGGYDLETVRNLSNSRIANHEVFKLIRKNSEWLSKQNDKEYPLNLDKYRAEQAKARETGKQIDSLLKLNKELNIAFLEADAKKYENDKDKQERYNLWLKNLSKDIYLDQAVKVVGDIRNQRSLANQPKKETPVKTF